MWELDCTADRRLLNERRKPVWESARIIYLREQERRWLGREAAECEQSPRESPPSTDPSPRRARPRRSQPDVRSTLRSGLPTLRKSKKRCQMPAGCKEADNERSTALRGARAGSWSESCKYWPLLYSALVMLAEASDFPRHHPTAPRHFSPFGTPRSRLLPRISISRYLMVSS